MHRPSPAPLERSIESKTRPAAGARVRRKLSRPRPPGAAPPAAANCLEAAGRPAPPPARRHAPGKLFGNYGTTPAFS
ncbi:hypothetical protein EVAR_102188_1 [Eumeta japonica]|uniref:Uncharacterized protein n=1 Tax=Eumeta variegata TaxID=151549 RepID=A0A4C2ABS4_EUMVA|nr:hypothetical protein EVAR_102188_1 [Eumeta japonica]